NSIFSSNQFHTATFSTAFLFKDLYNFANQAEQEFIILNQKLIKPNKSKLSETNLQTSSSKQISFFFYNYLKAYLKFVATNEQITNLNLKDALNKLFSKLTDSQTLAR
ncbi:13418_t:CDS:1, partial [Ambispora leptoticha]